MGRHILSGGSIFSNNLSIFVQYIIPTTKVVIWILHRRWTRLTKGSRDDDLILAILYVYVSIFYILNFSSSLFFGLFGHQSCYVQNWPLQSCPLRLLEDPILAII